MSFIFQGIPDRYDLRQKLKIGRTVAWLASRYRSAMKKKDTVYFWRGGDREYRGIYGWGSIVDNSPSLDSTGIYRVRVKYQKNFLDHDPPIFISSDEIANQPALQDLLILRMPIGTNFLLTETQEQAIQSLIVRKIGPAWAPPNRDSDGGAQS